MTIAFAVPPRVHLLDLSGPVHIFYEAREYGADIGLQYLSIFPEQPAPRNLHSGHSTGRAEHSSSELALAGLLPFSKARLQAGDLIFVPGLEMGSIQSVAFQKAAQPFLRWLKQKHAEGVTIAAVCTGAFLLGQAGLLDGRASTTHWKFFKLLQSQFPKTEVQQNRLFVESEGLFTSAGVASGIDLALYLLEQKFDARLASDVAREVVVYLRRGEQDPQMSAFLQYRNHLEDRIHLVQNFISQQLDKKPTVEELAELIYISTRHLTRLFKKTTGISIGEYTNRLRVERARQLLKQGHKVSYVATACGLSSENQLRHLLGKYLNKLPSEIS